MQTIHYSSGHSSLSHIEIWDDNHAERPGMYRAYWTANGTTGSPVIGYCSPGGSHRTVRAAAAEARRLYPGEKITRNGRAIA